MTKISPFLWFDHQAEEAAQYYTSIFPGSRIVDTSRHTEAGPGEAGSVMVVRFELDGNEFVALNGGPQNFAFNESVSFVVHCSTQEEVDHYWSRLSAGGGEEGPCGWLKDRYGLSWQIVPTRLLELITDPDRERADRAVQAMLKMSKLDIAAIEQAAAPPETAAV
jgi:predicted 3-demethylubiquinone-9 3-methyltransferase (glyoxalase superfamily)